MARPRKADNEPDMGHETRIAELEAALRPFALHGVKIRQGDRRGGTRKVIIDHGGHELTLGDFDQAARLICGGDNG